MIVRLAGVAVDARSTTRNLEGPRARAAAARWIAANALAATGRSIWLVGTPPASPRVFALHASCLTSVIAAIASVPVLVDTSLMPRHWRLALHALGLPELDCSSIEALAGGASILSVDGSRGTSLAGGAYVRRLDDIDGCSLADDASLSVESLPRGYRVRLAAPRPMLRA